MVLANRLREYLEYIAIARNLSPLTVKANKHTLGKFCELYGSVETSTLEFATMQDWMFIQGDQLNFHGRKKTPSTINTERAIVRAFLRYCRNSGDRLLFDPASMTNMKCRIKSRSVIKPEEILDVARAITNEKVRLLTLVTFFGGLRIGEAIKLRPSDIDGTVLLIQDSKSVDPRPAFIPQELIDEVWQYINKHRITTGRIFDTVQCSTLLITSGIQQVEQEVRYKSTLQNRAIKLHRTSCVIHSPQCCTVTELIYTILKSC